MDAITDMDTVEEKKSLRPKPKQKPKRAKIAIKMDEKPQTEADTNPIELSNEPVLDVAGQIYLWDISEEPNVVMRQSWLEEFLYKVLTHRDGVSTEVFTGIVGYLMHFVSPRFKREIFFYMTKDGEVYKFDPPKFNGPVATEIWS